MTRKRAAFSTVNRIVHKEFVPPGQTISAKLYCHVLRWRGRTCGRSSWTKCACTVGCSIMTMHQHTSLRLCSSFWPPQTWLSSPTPSVTRFSPLWLLSLPKDENKVEGAKIWHSKGYPGHITVGTEDAGTKGLSGQLPIVAEILRSFCMLPKGLLGRGW